MKTIVILLATLVGIAMSLEGLDEAEWEAWKTGFGKTYDSLEEETMRQQIYLDNKKLIDSHNLLAQNGEKSFTLAMNQFGDLTNEEFVAATSCIQMEANNLEGSTFIPPANFVAPKTVDWRKHGAVTGIKDQGQCGSCWAFSAVGSLEGQHFRKTKELVSLSEQNLVDCSRSYGNEGCNGGLMTQAFQYIKANKGIDTEKSYPYKAEDEKCVFDANNVGATCTGFVSIPQGSEKNLTAAIASIGPIAVAIDASSTNFQFYHSGVLDDPDCSSYMLDHGVVAVGYGTADGKDYYIVKNSWGEKWGLKGYVWMSRNKSNQCGIATSASYPLV